MVLVGCLSQTNPPYICYVLLLEVKESAAQDSKAGGRDDGQPEVINDIPNH